MKEGIASEYNAQLLVPESIISRVQFNLLDETLKVIRSASVQKAKET